ncbi:MAG: dihydropteroate synthase, partial [Bacteroidetes bacterium]|nr:dihydropteroate synthase [Bacteroidota bacterium]
NAGLPQVVDGKPHYTLTPAELTRWLVEFIETDGVNIVGGCCGTTAEHLAAVVERVGNRPPSKRRVQQEPSVSSIYQAVTIRQDSAVLAIGERTNANGSKKFRELLAAGDYDAMIQMGKEQVQAGSHLLDVCAAYVGRDETADMSEIIRRFATDITVPLVIDSTEVGVIEQALKLLGGRCIINSINLEDGEERFRSVVPLARKYGAALIVGTIDEDPNQGMAVTRERKLEVARRSYDLLTGQYGVDPTDIIFDPLVFPCATGDKNYIGSAAETIAGVKLIKEALPLAKTVLGISNVSFGLPASGREVLNAVFLYHCVQAGLDLAIVNTEKLERYASLSEEEKTLSDNLLFNRGDDPIADFAAFYRGKKEERPQDARRLLPLAERLARYIVDGSKDGLIDDLNEALQADRPLDIINGPLMTGMDEVGRLFNDNRLIVAEVLQSAEAMKAAVTHLEPHMDKAVGALKGSIILATVKGDVHDIGKKIVGVVLQCNNFEVIDLGVMVPCEKILDTARRENAQMIGLSGLITPSLDEMVHVAGEMQRQQFDLPLLIGGATTSPAHTAVKIEPHYDGPVLYVKDASRAVGVAQALIEPGSRDALVDKSRRDNQRRREQHSKKTRLAPQLSIADARERRHQCNWNSYVPPVPTFRGKRVLDNIELEDLRNYIDWMPFFNAWEFHGKFPNILSDATVGDAARSLYADATAMLDRIIVEKWLQAKAVFGFHPANSDGHDDVLVYADEKRESVIMRLCHLRQQRAKPSGQPQNCLADYIAPASTGKADHIGAFAVTAGIGIEEHVERFEKDHDDYSAIILKALADRLAEALTEYLHERVRRDYWAYAPKERLSSRPPYSRAKGTPCATAWSMMLFEICARR